MKIKDGSTKIIFFSVVIALVLIAYIFGASEISNNSYEHLEKAMRANPEIYKAVDWYMDDDKISEFEFYLIKRRGRNHEKGRIKDNLLKGSKNKNKQGEKSGRRGK